MGRSLTVLTLPFGGSDHWPIQMEASLISKPRNNPFRFENVWLTHLDFLKNIEKWWNEETHFQGTKMFLLHCMLKYIKGRLKEWNKNEFGNIFKAKGEVETNLKEINQILITEGYTEERQELVDSLQHEWENRCLQEEIFWRQKSRVQWIKEGERNTKFFHKSTIDHRNHNRIVKLTDHLGVERDMHEEMEEVLVQHFQSIAEETTVDRSQFTKRFTQYIPKLVSIEDKYNLNRPVTEEELEEVITEMHNGKALGPDGFNVDFFKTCWRIVRHDILEVVEDSRRSKTVLRALNESFIALIPKQEKATSPDRFRPIALCNVAGMIIKLDTVKAYDKLSWTYIKAMLKDYGFDYNWIRWVMALVTTASYFFLLNSSPSRTFKPTRGLKQGDPLSPFLFILMMEGLGRAIRATKEEGRIQGLRLTRGGDMVTHQQFVDDSMLQGTPIVKEAKALKQILYEFAMAAGTEVSLTKSKIFFFNTDISIQRNLSRILGFQRDKLPSKYLGVPLTKKPLHKDIWELILNKLKDKVSKWTNKALNLIGRLTLTKDLLQTIPIYMLSAISTPIGVNIQLRNIQRDFLWGKGEEKKKWALVAWERVCMPKAHGGLGLHDPGILNRFLGAKV
eukprot:PITA_20386